MFTSIGKAFFQGPNFPNCQRQPLLLEERTALVASDKVPQKSTGPNKIQASSDETAIAGAISPSHERPGRRTHFHAQLVEVVVFGFPIRAATR
jgi:hypothetical protein